MSQVRPMLAGKIEDLSKIAFPVLATQKLDGIRCIKLNGTAYTRALKLIPNKYIRELIEQYLPDGADGEIVVGRNSSDATSAVMSFGGCPEFTFYWFDYIKESPTKPYWDWQGGDSRMRDIYEWMQQQQQAGTEFPFNLQTVDPQVINDLGELLELEQQYLKDDFEGVMIRRASAPYKYGRSTNREGYLLKLKRFEDSEAEVLGYEEKLINTNEPTVNELGNSRRSHHKAGKVPAGTLGALLVKDIHTGIQFSIGSGFDDNTRNTLWCDRTQLIGKLIKYKFLPIGIKDAPRHPVFLGFRHPDDLGEPQSNP